MKPALSPFRVGDRVEWTQLYSRLGLGQNRGRLSVKPGSHRERGEVYRVDGDRVAVLPDDWKADGAKTGMLKLPGELTLL